MRNHSSTYDAEITSPARVLKAEFISAYEHSYHTDYIKSINIELPQFDSKFYGYSISSKATVVLLKKANRHAFTEGDYFDVKLGTNSQMMTYPRFYIDSIKTDAVSGEITIEGYDIIQKLNKYSFSDLNYGSTFTKLLSQIINDIGTLIGVSATNNGVNLSTVYSEQSLNVSGDTSIRDICNYIAEVTGTILIDRGVSGNSLSFIKLGTVSSLTINKANYFSSEIGEYKTLTRLTSSNSLGSFVSVGSDGYEQVLSDNAFLTNLTDLQVQAMLTNVFNNINRNMYNYDIDWRGNPALEYGDLITIETGPSTTISTNYTGESLKYSGGMKATSSWSSESQGTTNTIVSNNINTAIKRTEAKIDKANQEIELTVAEIDTAKNPYATLKLKLDSIEQAVGLGNMTYKQATIPTGPSGRGVITGDLWFCTGTPTGYVQNKWYRYNGSNWEQLTDADIVSIQGWRSEFTMTPTQIETKVNDTETTVSGLSSTVSSHTSLISQNSNKISLVVEEQQGSNVIKAASIVTAINDESSSVKIDADHIELSGDVVLKSNLTDGVTSISGNNIKTGTISSSYIDTSQLSANSILVKDSSNNTIFEANGNNHLAKIGTMTLSHQGLTNWADGTGGYQLLLSNPDNIGEINFKVASSHDNAYISLRELNGNAIGNLKAFDLYLCDITESTLNQSYISDCNVDQTTLDKFAIGSMERDSTSGRNAVLPFIFKILNAGAYYWCDIGSTSSQDERFNVTVIEGNVTLKVGSTTSTMSISGYLNQSLGIYPNDDKGFILRVATFA